jgi:hypothetical protein
MWFDEGIALELNIKAHQIEAVEAGSFAARR